MTFSTVRLTTKKLSSNIDYSLMALKYNFKIYEIIFFTLKTRSIQKHYKVKIYILPRI